MMKIRVLLLNLPMKNKRYSSSVEVFESTLKKLPTLHDYHAIIIDTEKLVSPELTSSWTVNEQKEGYSNYYKLKEKIEEAISTGVWLFCISGTNNSFFPFKKWTSTGVYSYAWCAPSIEINSESGDTVKIEQSEVKYYFPLTKEVSDIYWSCYFSKYPEDSRIISTNRAGYAIFLEVPNGKGNYVFLPKFKNEEEAILKIINEIIPNVLKDEPRAPVPKWVSNFIHPIETQTRTLMRKFEQAKKILYTNDSGTEKASALILEELGFEVERLPAGTLPDLRFEYLDTKRLVEIKGHEKRQTKRKEVLQLVGYLLEDDLTENGMVISNHEFLKHPENRSENAYTDAAIDFAKKNQIVLLSSIDLWNLFILKNENKLLEDELAHIRNKIISGKGILKFDDLIQKK